MSILPKLIPIILLSIIFYLFIYDLYPKYQEILKTAQRLNELKNQEKELDLNLQLVQNIKQNPNIQELLKNKNLLNAWLPLKPNVEEALYFFYLSFQKLGFNLLDSININISESALSLNANVLPVSSIQISLSGSFGNQIKEVIKLIESSTRILKIKKLNVNKDGKVNMEVEGYYLSTVVQER
jgi:hypothetical protein